jgi:hypothetical protein
MYSLGRDIYGDRSKYSADDTLNAYALFGGNQKMTPDWGWNDVSAKFLCMQLLKWMTRQGAYTLGKAVEHNHVRLLTWMTQHGMSRDATFTASCLLDSIDVLDWLYNTGYVCSDDNLRVLVILYAIDQYHLETFKWLRANTRILNRYWTREQMQNIFIAQWVWYVMDDLSECRRMSLSRNGYGV